MNELLRRVRRRLRLAWVAAVAQATAPVLAASGLGIILLGWLTPLQSTRWVAFVLGTASCVALGAMSLVLPIPEAVSARAADRGLRTQDAFATALEFAGSQAPLADRVVARAEQLARGRTASEAVPVPVRVHRLALTVALAAVIAALVILPNPRDRARARAAAQRALAAAEGRKVQQVANALARAPGATAHQAAVANQLSSLAHQLQHAAGLAEASRAVDRLAAALASQLSPNALSEKAAARGLERSLSAKPLTSTGSGSAAQQLSQTSQQLSHLDQAARAGLAERLNALAATQTEGDPKAASDLTAAGNAVASGDDTAAASALGAAAADQNNARADVADQAATATAIGALGDVSGQLAAGSNPASSQGTSGQRRNGNGQGQGQGQGHGQGGGAGGASGRVGGSNAATAGNGAQGGPGSPNGSGHNASVGLQQATVYDPVTSGQGDQLNAAGPLNGGPTQIIGRATGPNVATGPSTPLASVLPRYEAEATQALDTLNLPPSQRSLVESYFQGLASDQ